MTTLNGSVADKTAPEPSLQARLAKAVQSQQKRVIDAEVFTPVSENCRGCFEPSTKTWLAVTFEERKDGSIRIVDITDLEAAIRQFAAANRDAISKRVAGMTT